MRSWPRSRPGKAYLAGSPLLIAHRGGAGLAPENTMEAFRAALRDWAADMLELDVRTSRDGVVMVFHDDSVDRTTDGSGLVADMTAAELGELDAGHSFLDPDGRPSFRGKGVRIPTFETLLDTLQGVRLNVEAKDGRSANRLVEVIRRHGAEHRVLVTAEWERNRRRARNYPGPWGASRLQVTAFFLLTAARVSRFYTPGCDALQVPELHNGIRILTPRFLAEAHRRNLPVHVWTVDDPLSMRRLLDMGVDGIQTDRPDLLGPILTEMVGRPPSPAMAGPSPFPVEVPTGPGPAEEGGE